MGTAASAEPCVYERLWESIAVLRESGHRYGMSERDIERFITQVLQTNEPQPHDEPPEQEPEQDGLPHAFPLLRATAKCALALCLLLVLGLGLASPQSHSGPLSLNFNWSCPLGAARLLDLPIAHKYNLQGYRGWWGSGLSTVNSSVCAEEPRLVVVKGGDAWRLRRPDLEQLFQAHPDSVSVRADHGLCPRDRPTSPCTGGRPQAALLSSCCSPQHSALCWTAQVLPYCAAWCPPSDTLLHTCRATASRSRAGWSSPQDGPRCLRLRCVQATGRRTTGRPDCSWGPGTASSLIPGSGGRSCSSDPTRPSSATDPVPDQSKHL